LQRRKTVKHISAVPIVNKVSQNNNFDFFCLIDTLISYYSDLIIIHRTLYIEHTQMQTDNRLL